MFVKVSRRIHMQMYYTFQWIDISTSFLKNAFLFYKMIKKYLKNYELSLPQASFIKKSPKIQKIYTY